MEILNNHSLKQFNTFNVEAKSKYFVRGKSVNELKDILQSNIVKDNSHYILGGGSNVLFTENYEGVIIYPDIEGKQILSEDEDKVNIEVNCGEQWDSFVEYCVENGFGGIENLSGIPGKVGAVPIQNIGAYGMEARDTIIAVNALDINSGQEVQFSNQECEFGYRDSVFKHKYKNKYIITSVIFELAKNSHLVTDYGTLYERLQNKPQKNIQTVREIILNIREEKLPDPEEIGNAGSFFKNPIVDKDTFEQIREQYEEMPYYEMEEQKYKIPAGWMIEECGWKEKDTGKVGVYKNQALILVNYGKATGEEIYTLSRSIKKDVKNKFGIELQEEVEII